MGGSTSGQPAIGVKGLVVVSTVVVVDVVALIVGAALDALVAVGWRALEQLSNATAPRVNTRRRTTRSWHQ